MINFKNVTKTYLTKAALKDVTMVLPSGKIIGIVGSNGSGKSTTLKLISGLCRPSKGTVTINGHIISRRSSNTVSYLSELDAYYSFYTVKETLDFFATQFADFNLNKAEDIMHYMSLEPNQKVKHLSKGNRGRLKIVLTLAREVPLILMDEPLSGLDPMVRDSIIKGLISYVDLEKQTVIITTHEVNEVEPLLDMIVAIKDGKVIKIADVEELRQSEMNSVVEWMKKVYE